MTASWPATETTTRGWCRSRIATTPRTSSASTRTSDLTSEQVLIAAAGTVEGASESPMAELNELGRPVFVIVNVDMRSSTALAAAIDRHYQSDFDDRDEHVAAGYDPAARPTPEGASGRADHHRLLAR